MNEFYKILGIPTSASVEDIKRAYRQKMKEIHPDLYQDQNPQLKKLATMLSQHIIDAYNAIMNALGNLSDMEGENIHNNEEGRKAKREAYRKDEEEHRTKREAYRKIEREVEQEMEREAELEAYRAAYRNAMREAMRGMWR
jgi:DnaJ-class molecular chaperone